MDNDKIANINLRFSRKEMFVDELTLKNNLCTTFGNGEINIYYICDICDKKHNALNNLISIKCTKCDNYVDYCYNDHENIDINANLLNYCSTCNKDKAE